jgi:hypothetical protein
MTWCYRISRRRSSVAPENTTFAQLDHPYFVAACPSPSFGEDSVTIVPATRFKSACLFPKNHGD